METSAQAEGLRYRTNKHSRGEGAIEKSARDLQAAIGWRLISAQCA